MEMPLLASITIIRELQPGTKRSCMPRRKKLRTYNTSKNARNRKAQPPTSASRSGAREKENIPSDANRSIFLREYLDRPARRVAGLYGRMTVRNAIQDTMPRKKR